MQGVPVVACTDGGGLLDVVPPQGAGQARCARARRDRGRRLRSVLADPAARRSAHDAGVEWRERLAPGHVADRCLAWYREALDE